MPSPTASPPTRARAPPWGSPSWPARRSASWRWAACAPSPGRTGQSRGLWRLPLPVAALGLVGALSIAFPEILGNGKDAAQLAFAGDLSTPLLLVLMVAKPLAVILCCGAGAPGGLFTPTLATGALIGGALGEAWLLVWPGAPLGLCALLGAAALLAATTQGPISAIVLMIELTGRDRAFIEPLLLVVMAATLTARTIERRSIYEARLSDDEVAERLRLREAATGLGRT